MSTSDVASTVKRVLNSNKEEKLNGFFIATSGQIEFGSFPGLNQLYCKYDFTYGPNWQIVQGIDKGISQIAMKADGANNSIVWNFPIDVVFKATNAHGWPRMVISVFGLDGLGRDVVRGYGSLHIPTTPGNYTRRVRMFRPVSPSLLQQFIAWIKGTPPEYYDSRFVSKSEGREVTMVQSSGFVNVNINIVARGMKQLGYQDGKFLEEGCQSNLLSKQQSITVADNKENSGQQF